MSPWRGLLIVLACLTAATLVRFALTPLLGTDAPFATYFPAILIATAWAGGVAGIVVLICGSAIAGYVWLTPPWGVRLISSSWALIGIFWFVGATLIAIAALMRALVESRIEAETRATLVAGEMRHRVSNVLSVVIAISQQTARHAGSVTEYQVLFGARLLALGRVQDLVTEQADRPLDLRSLLQRMLEPFGADRFDLSGPAASILPDALSSLALLVHELGTNATKYGALSVPGGHVAISWEKAPPQARLEWREVNGPPVATPTRSGFGSRLMQAAVPPQSVMASVSFEPDGVRCVIRLPTSPA